MSVEQKQESNITTQLELEIMLQMISAIQHKYAAECNAEIRKIIADYRDFVNMYPVELFVTEPYVENNGSATARRYHDAALSMVAAFYGIEEISCTVWADPNWRDGDPPMYLYAFGRKIGHASALLPQFTIVD